MSNDRLADIKARTDAATSGPWTVMWPGQCCDGYCIEEASVHGAEHSMSDAEFIAASRDDIPHLLALVESLTAERDALRARLAAMEALADRWQKYAATLDPMSVESAASIAAIATMKGAYEGCAEKIRAALATTGEGQ